MKAKKMCNKTSTKSNKHNIIITGFIIIILILCIAFFAYFLDWLGKRDFDMDTHVSPPYINYTVEKMGDDYNIIINRISPSSCDLNLKHFKIEILNESYFLIMELPLTNILNNESSNIIFYDNDNNNTLSKGDVITFKDGIVDKNWSFVFYYKNELRADYRHYF